MQMKQQVLPTGREVLFRVPASVPAAWTDVKAAARSGFRHSGAGKSFIPARLVELPPEPTRTILLTIPISTSRDMLSAQKGYPKEPMPIRIQLSFHPWIPKPGTAGTGK